MITLLPPHYSSLINQTVLMNYNCKTSCGLIQDVYSPTGSSDLFMILGCMTSNFLYLSFSTLYSSSLWRTDTILWAKLNNPHPLKQLPPSVLSFPHPLLNVCEIKKLPQGLNRGFAEY